MRTTLNIDDNLLRQAKVLAALTDKTLTQVIEDALQESLTRTEARVALGRVTLPTFKGGKPRPGVDLSNSAALLDVMEQPDADT